MEQNVELWLKNPKKLFWINLFTNLSALTSIITLFYLKRGLTYTEIAFLATTISLSIILLEVPTGILSDKIGRKKTIIFGIVSLLGHGVIYLFANNFIFFMLAFILFAGSVSLFSGCMTAFIYDSLKIAKKEELAKKYLGHFRSAPLLAAIIVPPIASTLAQDLLNWQFLIIIFINILGYLLALLIALTLHEPKDGTPRKQKS